MSPLAPFRKPAIDNQDIEALTDQRCDENTIFRMQLVAWCTAAAYAVYGYSSYDFIHFFKIDVTLFGNIWPRLLFTTLPLCIAAIFLKKSTFAAQIKLRAYIFLHSLVFFISSCIYVWPIAIRENPTIMLYVSGANSTFLCATWTILAIPLRHLRFAFATIIMFVVLPIITVVAMAEDHLIRVTLMNDTLLALLVGLGCGYLLSRYHRQSEQLRIQQEKQSSSFLGDYLMKAIYEGKTEFLNDKRAMGYVFFMDIRNSTKLAKELGKDWDNFYRYWVARANNIVRKYNGYFVKSAGDSILVCFGLFEESDLTDLPELGPEILRAENKQLKKLCQECLECIDTLVREFREATKAFFPSRLISAGVGLDRGFITRGVRGDASKLEYDVWGDCVNVAAKLEGFAKDTDFKCGPGDCLVVVSPFASDFIEDKASFQVVPTREKSLLQSQGIRWVLVKKVAADGSRLSELSRRYSMSAIVLKLSVTVSQDSEYIEPSLFRRFLIDYNVLVLEVLSAHGGHCHKIDQDGLLISFGAVGPHPVQLDTNNGPKEAGNKRIRYDFQRALSCVDALATEFEKIKARYELEPKVSLGAGLSYGEVEIATRSEEGTNRSLEIDGRATQQAIQIHGYLQQIRKQASIESSLLVVAPDLEPYMESNHPFTLWNIHATGMRVRNFPDITHLYYRKYQGSQSALPKTSKNRAS